MNYITCEKELEITEKVVTIIIGWEELVNCQFPRKNLLIITG